MAFLTHELRFPLISSLQVESYDELESDLKSDNFQHKSRESKGIRVFSSLILCLKFQLKLKVS